MLYQLLCLIGEENFQNALQNHFKISQWGNCTREHFILNLQNALQGKIDQNLSQDDFDLEEWQRDWFLAAGHNVLELK